MAKKKNAHLGINYGLVHVYTSFNNTIINITDNKGNTLTWASGGSSGFKGAKKSSLVASSKTAQQAIKALLELGIKNVDIIVKGFGPGRDHALNAFHHESVKVNSITDLTPVPHNGCRPPKARN